VVPAALPRLEQLVEANIRGVHAYELKLARTAGKGDPACWSTRLSDAAIDALVAHQAALLATDPATVKAWAEGRASTFDPARDLEPLLRSGLVLADALPVSVYTAYLTAAAPGRPRAHIRAIANLYQTVLEVDRDGDVLQDLYRFDIGLGLPVYVGQLGLPGTDEDLLAVGRRLEGKSCVSPVGTTAAEWQIAGRKIWNWGEKNLHVRDARVVGDELLAEPAVAALVPKMRGLPVQRIAVIGHSFTMDLHWSSPSAFVPIVTAMFARENPRWSSGSSRAAGSPPPARTTGSSRTSLAWKPDRVLLVVLNRTDEDLESFARLGRALTAAGARCTASTTSTTRTRPIRAPGQEWATGRASGITIVEVARLLAAAPTARASCAWTGST
jgi:hypothetical protein